MDTDQTGPDQTYLGLRPGLEQVWTVSNFTTRVRPDRRQSLRHFTRDVAWPINPTSLNKMMNVMMSGEKEIIVAACTASIASSLGAASHDDGTLLRIWCLHYGAWRTSKSSTAYSFEVCSNLKEIFITFRLSRGCALGWNWLWPRHWMASTAVLPKGKGKGRCSKFVSSWQKTETFHLGEEVHPWQRIRGQYNTLLPELAAAEVVKCIHHQQQRCWHSWRLWLLSVYY